MTTKTKKDTDFAEDNAVAQAMAIPRAIPRLTNEEDTEAVTRSVSVLDLRDEVKKNLVGYETMELDQLLINTLFILKNPVTIDRIVMTLWLEFKYTKDRSMIVKRLKVMAEEGITQKLPGSKSTYELTDHGKSLPIMS